jgi:hypothetical protein
MTDPSDPSQRDDRAAYIRALIAHRCPELSADEVAEAFAPVDELPAGITDQVLDVIAALADRLEVLEASHAPPRLN